jgi:PAS domain S-box-containing protein/diguanylate cyclase (GGDEF)-like protein
METGRDANGIRSLNRHTLEQIIAASSAGILVADAQNPQLPVVYVNSAFERLTGYSCEELAGRPWPLLARATESDTEIERLKAALGRHEACRVTVPDLRKDGTAWTSQVSVTPLHNARGELKYFLCLQHGAAAAPIGMEIASPLPDVAESTGELALLQRDPGRARQKAATLERIDPGTGLLRFTYFQETVRRDLAVARRDGRTVTLLAFEIVDFDVYRQTFGSKAADSCQRMIGAQIMRVLRRAGDLCARYDDTTLVAAVVGQEAAEIQHLADQIAENVRQLGLHNPRAKTSRYITTRAVVIGCAPGAAEDPESMIARALAGHRGTDARPRAALA